MAGKQGFIDIRGKTLERRVLCSGCGLFLKDAMQTSCGHHYCEKCLFIEIEPRCSALKINKCMEPNCTDPIIKIEECFPDRAIRREVVNMMFRCSNKGCEFTDKRLVQIDHDNVCDFKEVACSNEGCSSVLLRMGLAGHMEQDCSKACQYCDEQVALKDITEHVDKMCSLVTIDCSYEGCKEKVSRKDMVEHCRISTPEHLFLVKKAVDSLSSTVMAHVEGDSETESPGDKDTTEYLETHEHIRTLQREVNRLTRVVMELKKSQDLPTCAGMAITGGNIVDDAGLPVSLQDMALEIKCLRKEMNEFNQQCGSEAEQERSMSFVYTSPSLHSNRGYPNRQYTAPEDVASYDGTLLWKVTDVEMLRREALVPAKKSIYSPPFYTARNGYRMCARLYPNGDGNGIGTHMSLFFVLMRGNCDALLSWPFDCKVTLILLDQDKNENIEESFSPDADSSSFTRPTREMNVASGCPTFAAHKALDSPKPSYIRNDTLFIKIIVDTHSLREI